MNDLIDVKTLRENLGITQKELAKMIGVSEKTVQNWEYGRKVPETKSVILRSLSLKKPIKYAGGTDDAQLEHKGNVIPFYDDVVSIGGKNQLGSDMSGISQPSEYIDTGDWFKNATAAIRHYGESMLEYPAGCILAIKEVINRDLIVPGRDYVIETSEYRVTKRLQSGKDENYFAAYSTNPEKYADGRLVFEPFEIPKEEIKHLSLVLGYVVKKNGETFVFNNNKP